MPATVTVKIFEARHLPIMDRGGETTDAFVEVRLTNSIFKTEVCRRTLNPKWDSDWFKFEVNDEELQEEPLQIRVMDYDTYTSHDAIGRCYVDLTNMLISENRSVFSGWLPIYDTLSGIRGQLKLEVRLHPFCVDMVRRAFWHSSATVLFFSSVFFPSGFRVKRLVGLVDHSLVAEDPENQWIDKIRTPRSTNEARQILFMKMSGELRRKLGNKVVDMGGNAVLGLRQRLDLGHIGVIVRAIGCCAVVEKVTPSIPDLHEPAPSVGHRKASKLDTVPGSPETTGPVTIKIHDLSVGEAEASQTLFSEAFSAEYQKPATFYLGGSIDCEQQSQPASQETGYMLVQAEYPFFTLKHFPAGIVKSLGGIVSCRMTKTLERLDQDDANQMTYSLWWKELRQEITRHMKCVGCNAVIGYSEELSLTDDGNIQLMCATGTAALIDIPLLIQNREVDMVEAACNAVFVKQNVPKDSAMLRYPEATNQLGDCRLFHLPVGEYSDHVALSSASCSVCKIGHVPDMLLTTIEPLESTPLRGIGTLVQARVHRKTKPLKGESGCRELSEALPFLEYDLHSQIALKLKLLGFNAVFNLQIDIQCGVETVVGCATGTGVFISCLPKPARPTVIENSPGSDSADMQSKLDQLIDQYSRQLGLTDEKEDAKQNSKATKTPRPNVRKKKTTGVRQYSKSTFLVDLEEHRAEGRDICALIDFVPPRDAVLVGTEICAMHDRIRQNRCTDAVSGRSSTSSFMQNFCRVWRTRSLTDQDEPGDIAANCRHLLKDIVFRARMYKPCRITGLEFRLLLTSEDEVMIIAQGTIVPEPQALYTNVRHGSETRKVMRNVASRIALSGSEDNTEPSPTSKTRPEELVVPEPSLLGPYSTTRHNMSSVRQRLTPPGASHLFFQNQILSASSTNQPHVSISSLSFVHSGVVRKYVGSLNLVALRECQSVKEIGGLSGFMQRALADFYAMVRAQTLCAGGNTILTFRVSQLQLADSYNQAQCILAASGDMAFVEQNDGTPNITVD